MTSMKRALKRGGMVLVAVLLVVQFIPMARTNPAPTREVRWNATATRALAVRSCFDCHSDATVWPWYSHVAPVAWFVINHVNDGRRRMNFSEWDLPQRATFDDVEKNVTSGDMPIWNYVMMHKEAKLTPAETTQLLAGLRATFLQDPPIPRRR
jgi:hypothetical protein